MRRIVWGGELQVEDLQGEDMQSEGVCVDGLQGEDLFLLAISCPGRNMCCSCRISIATVVGIAANTTATIMVSDIATNILPP